MAKKCLAFVLFVALLVPMTACFAVDPDMAYIGEHPEFAATAIYSIPGIESSREDTFVILDEDEYGRVLFAAYLPDGALINNSYNNGILGVFVMQGSDEHTVQFYCEKNYIARIVEAKIDLNKEGIEHYFSEEEIEMLKAANDWNGEPTDENIIHVPLSVEKSESLSSKMRKQIEKKIGSNFKYAFFREGPDGKKVFFILNIAESNPKYTWYLVAFDSKGVLLDDGAVSISKDMEALPSSVNVFLEKISVSAE